MAFTRLSTMKASSSFPFRNTMVFIGVKQTPLRDCARLCPLMPTSLWPLYSSSQSYIRSQHWFTQKWLVLKYNQISKSTVTSAFVAACYSANSHTASTWILQGCLAAVFAVCCLAFPGKINGHWCWDVIRLANHDSFPRMLVWFES